MVQLVQAINDILPFEIVVHLPTKEVVIEAGDVETFAGRPDITF
jgi:hypothetical protein